MPHWAISQPASFFPFHPDQADACFSWWVCLTFIYDFPHLVNSESMQKADSASNIQPAGKCTALLYYSYRWLVKVITFQMAQNKYQLTYAQTGSSGARLHSTYLWDARKTRYCLFYLTVCAVWICPGVTASSVTSMFLFTISYDSWSYKFQTP